MNELEEVYRKLMDKGFSLINTIEQFENDSTNIPLEEHIDKHRIEIEEKFKNHTKVYLDTKFWLYFRDAELGNPRNDDTEKLYKSILKKVSEGKIICPISTTNLVEVLRQSDPSTRTATLKVMNQLSGGVSFRFYFERFVDEFISFIIKASDVETDYIETNFDLIGHVMGISKLMDYSMFSGFSKLSVDKGFYELFKLIDLEDLVKTLVLS